MPTNSPRRWQDQYDRMSRWHQRISKPRRVDFNLIDDCDAFFANAFHLKDWLQADTTLPREIREVRKRGKERSTVVEDYLEGNLWLRLCADLANGSKHMVLTKRKRFTDASSVQAVRVFSTRGFQASAFSADARLYVVIGQNRYLVRRVADR